MSLLVRGLSNLIGLVVPIIYSFKILKKPTNKRLILATQYWCVYGSLLIIDWLLGTLFISCFIPFYDFFVLMLTILMVVPQIGFSSVLYTKFLAPFLRKYERRIDRVGERIVEKVWQHIPGIAATIPALITSFQFLTGLDTPAEPISRLQIEDVTELDALTPRRLRQVNRSVEVQSEDDDDEEIESFVAVASRQIKQEPEDYEEELVVAEFAAQNQKKKASPRLRNRMQTRRQTRARSTAE